MLKDHLEENLSIVFIGYNPSLVSEKTGHHYANPNNRFWRILHAAGLTDRRLLPEEDYLLPLYGYGLTNIVSRPTKAADEISRKEYTEGREILKAKIIKYQPRIACFVGKGVYEQYSMGKNVPWGCQEEQIVPGTYDFVAPSSSGLVRMKLEEITDIYKKLNSLKQKLLEN